MDSKQNKYSEIDYWIACSGGLDSVFLVHLFVSMNKRVGVLHCNFKLREEESDGDELFVRNLAKELNLPIQVKTFDVNAYKNANKTNTQLAARNMRYAWFDEIKKNTRTNIVLGHHRDDQRETFFLQLLRGASVNGLAAMPCDRDGYIRPLLGYSKEELRLICVKNGWKWREDSSNLNDDYTRNDLRINLLPRLVENGLNLKLIDELIEGYQLILNYLEKNKIQVADGDYRLTILEWKELPIFYQNTLLEDIGFGKNNKNLVHQVAASNKGAYANRNGVELWNEGEYLLFKRNKISQIFPELYVTSIIRSELDFTSADLFVDKDKVEGNIYLRYWLEGDEFSPLGLKGNKKVSDFLKDKKVRSSDKKHQLVVCDELGIIGVVGFAPSNRVKITASSKHFLRLSVESFV